MQLKNLVLNSFFLVSLFLPVKSYSMAQAASATKASIVKNINAEMALFNDALKAVRKCYWGKEQCTPQEKQKINQAGKHAGAVIVGLGLLAAGSIYAVKVVKEKRAKSREQIRKDWAQEEQKTRVKKTKIGEKYDLTQGLMDAAAKGDVGVVEALIEAGANPNAIDKNGNTALMLAALNGRVDVMEALIDAGAGLNEKWGNTALMDAARYGKVGVVQKLIKARADLNATDENGNTALMLAALNGKVDVVEALIDAGANLDRQDRIGATALIWALYAKKADVAKLLVEKGANKDLKTVDGDTAYTYGLEVLLTGTGSNK